MLSHLQTLVQQQMVYLTETDKGVKVKEGIKHLSDLFEYGGSLN